VSDGPELTPEDVTEILRLVDESGLDELELETGRFSVRFRRSGNSASPQEPVAQGLLEVTAPSPGTFYRSPAPGEPPYVDVGSVVEPQTQVCILEVMKLMNPIHAGVAGTVVEVCRNNGGPVQYGDVLFRIAP
jgi:biotin carboxyl carrier protein